jgi:hypothetical protein
MNLQTPVDVCKAASGLAMQEAVNLGDMNPAQMRRLGERMDQLFTALMRGAGLQWDQSNGSLKIVWPEVVNPILAAAKEKARLRELAASTVIPDAALTGAEPSAHSEERDEPDFKTRDAMGATD